jgi:hypothetical protein
LEKVMAQIITENFRVFSAAEWIESVSNTNRLYLTVGRPQNWPAEPTPPTPINNEYQDLIYWAETIALKRILPTDYKQVAKRYDWSAGVVYTQYDNLSSNIYGSNFYVLTVDNNVYKCISNNFGAASTTKPTGTLTSIITTADGYRWKYLYSLTDTDLLKFLTADYMPVNINNDVVSTAIKGTLDNIIVTNAGNLYTTNSNIIISISGDGSGAEAGSVILTGANTINKIQTSLNGSNYTFATIAISGGSGSNATARAIVSPKNGHGYDAYSELGAKYVMVNARLNYAEGSGDFPIVNDYRRIGIVKNPISNTTSLIATETTLNSTHTITLSNITGTFTIDEKIYGSNSNVTGFVVSTTANAITGNGAIRYITPIELYSGNVSFINGETIVGSNSLASGRITGITVPEVNKNTGQILYVENRSKITRNSDQAENIHIVIEF